MSSAPQLRSGHCFSRKQRLLSAQEFSRVLRSGRYKKAGSLQMVTLPNELGHARLGFVVSKKSVPKAAARNRLKRVTRELFRHYAPDLPAIDLVVQSRAPTPRASRKVWRSRLQPLFAGVL